MASMKAFLVLQAGGLGSWGSRMQEAKCVSAWIWHDWAGLTVGCCQALLVEASLRGTIQPSSILGCPAGYKDSI